MSDLIATYKRERGVVTDYWTASCDGKVVKLKWTTSAGTISTKSVLCRSDEEARQRLSEMAEERASEGFVASDQFVDPPADLEKVPDDEASLLRSLEYAKYHFHGRTITPALQKRLCALYSKTNQTEKLASLAKTIQKQQERLSTGGVIDKAKWHYDGDYPKDLGQDQAYVHIGFFIAWLFTRDHFNVDLFDGASGKKALKKLKDRKVSPGQFAREQCDGVFTDEMIADDAIDFAEEYFSGDYLKDYSAILAGDLPTLYHVKDDWSNFDRLAELIDLRFSAYTGN